jgi:hypothetical protein
MTPFGRTPRFRRTLLPPSSCWYPTATLHGVTTQKTSTPIFTVVETSNLANCALYPSVLSVSQWNSWRTQFQNYNSTLINADFSSSNKLFADCDTKLRGTVWSDPTGLSLCGGAIQVFQGLITVVLFGYGSYNFRVKATVHNGIM